MDTRTYNINLRNDYFNPVAVGLSQYDEGVTLAFNVYDGTDPAEFAAGTTAQIMGVRPSGVGFDVACTLTDNVATVSTITDMTGEAGIFPVEIRFYNSGVNVGTCNFIFVIEKAAHPDGTIDADITHEQDIVDKINQILVQTTPDPTLSESGKAADAAATGQAIEIANESIRILGASLNTEINNVDSDVRKKAPVIWKEASGNPVIVEDGAGYVKDRAAQMYAFNVAVDFEPVQDFNGYDYAWAGGNGKNLLPYPYFDTSKTSYGVTFTDNGDGSITANGTATANVVFQFTANAEGALNFLPTGDYTFSGCPSGGGATTYALQMRVNGTWIDDFGTGITTAYDAESGGIDTYRIRVMNGYTINNVTFWPMIRRADITDATYAPYENICPISGAESVTVKRTGKNMCPIGTSRTATGITFTVNGDGSVTANGTATATTFWAVQFTIPKGTYKLTGCPTGGGLNTYRIDVRAYIGGNVINTIVDTGDGMEFTLEDSLTAYVNIRIASGYTANNLTFYPMIRPASIIDDTYEPFKTPPAFAEILGGHYYGGTIDIATGQLEVTWQSFTFDGSSDEDWAPYSETGRTWPTLWGIPSVSGIDYTAKPYCETWRTKISTPTKDELGTIGIAQQSPAGFIDVRPPVDYATKAAWRTYLAANPITIWVKMKEPITVGTLDWYDLEMLYKYNVLTTDGTNIRLVYPVDTKIYIDNAIAAISG